MRLLSRTKRAVSGLLSMVERRNHRREFSGRCLPFSDTMACPPPVDNRRTTSTGKTLNNPYLAGVLAQDELGTWALDADTLNFLEREIKDTKPQAILEFGAGLSTLCFARYMQECERPAAPCVFSIEQNEWQVHRSRERLEQIGLAPWVQILHAPLIEQTIEGLATECYGLPADVRDRFFGSRKPDFVFVDGPSGNSLVRYGTLPLVREHLAAGALVFLDDALRPEEKEVASRWHQQHVVTDLKLCLRGKGLWIGRLCGDEPGDEPGA